MSGSIDSHDFKIKSYIYKLRIFSSIQCDISQSVLYKYSVSGLWGQTNSHSCGIEQIKTFIEVGYWFWYHLQEHILNCVNIIRFRHWKLSWV